MLQSLRPPLLAAAEPVCEVGHWYDAILPLQGPSSSNDNTVRLNIIVAPCRHAYLTLKSPTSGSQLLSSPTQHKPEHMFFPLVSLSMSNEIDNSRVEPSAVRMIWEKRERES